MPNELVLFVDAIVFLVFDDLNSRLLLVIVPGVTVAAGVQWKYSVLRHGVSIIDGHCWRRTVAQAPSYSFSLIVFVLTTYAMWISFRLCYFR